MRRAVVILLVGGLLGVVGCFNGNEDTTCTDPGGTCVTTGSGLTCTEVLPYPCSTQGAVCCVAKPSGSSSSGSSSGGTKADGG
jgi:hypothetical protein